MTTQEYNAIFSRNLKNYLNLNKKSQADLARYLNVSTATVNYWCRGSKSPRMDKVDRMCEFLGVRRSDLMEDKPSSPASPSSAAPQELTEDAAALLGKYERLNDGGKKDLHNRADELIALGKTIEEDAKKDSIRSA